MAGMKGVPKAASYSPDVCSSIASNTGAKPPGEELITCSISAVAT
jgi:hypothetical protein